MKNTLTIKATFTKEVEVSFPVYFANERHSIIYACYDENTILRTDNESINKVGLPLDYIVSTYEHYATSQEFIALCKEARAHQQKLFIDITWKESMEQNPTMADMTVKDYSREREEEMNMGVREADKAEQMERNAEIED